MVQPNLTRNLYFLTPTVVNWVDVFTRPVYNHIIVDSLRFCQEQKGLEIFAWVLMSNHLHLIVGVDKDLSDDEIQKEVSNVIRDFKKFTSKKIVEAIIQNEQESRREWMLNRFEYAGANDKKIVNYRFWQEGNHEEIIVTNKFLWQKIDYIHMNPVRREIVSIPEDYIYSSASNYAGTKGILEVRVIDSVMRYQGR